MKERVKKVFNFVTNTRVYTLVYLAVCILWFFPLLGDAFDPISKICFIWGAVILISDLFLKRRCLKARNFALCFIMLAAYAVGTLLTIRVGINSAILYDGIKNLIYNGILLLIIYAQNAAELKEEVKKTLYSANQIIIYIAIVAGTISLGMFLFDIGFQFYSGDLLLSQGFLENRLWGVYTSSNTGALLAIISIAASLMNEVMLKKQMIQSRIQKINIVIYRINLIVQTCYYALTLSRGGYITLCAFGGILIFLLLFPKMAKKKGIIVSGLISICAVIVFGIGVDVGAEVLRNTLVIVPNTIRYDNYVHKHDKDDEESTETEDEYEKIVLERVEDGSDISNKRFSIWEAGISIWKESPLFGIINAKTYEGDTLTNPLVNEGKLTDFNISELKRARGNMHCVYVQILVYSGIIGAGIFVLIAILLIKRFGLFLCRTESNSNEYKLIAIIFSLLASFAVNGLVESHLLFNRQDPYGVIFWLYTGIGEALIVFFSKNLYIKKKGKKACDVAIACDTPLQIMNAVRMVEGKQLCDEGKIDLYIYHQFTGAQEVSEKIKQKKLFNHVYDIEKFSEGNKINTFFRLLFPKWTINKYSHEHICFEQKNYSKLVMAAEIPFTISLYMSTDYVDTYFYEEGTASYFVNTNNNTSEIFKLIDKVLFGGRLFFQPKAIYLSNINMATNDMTDNYVEIKKETKDTIKKLEGIFSYSAHNLYQKKIIYLSQPLYELCDDFQVTEEKLLSNLLERTSIVIRKHPRYSLEILEQLGNKIDLDEGNLWELECLKEKITNEHILISCFSTAQFMPKILRDNEPVLIFTYKILFKPEELKKTKWQNIISLVGKLENMYKNPEKIFVPESLDELLDFLQNS